MPLAALRAQRGRIRLLRHGITWDLEMTLAAILLVSIFCASSAAPAAARHQNAPQAAPASKPPETSATQDQATAPPVQNPPAASQASPSAATPVKKSSGQTRPTTAKRRRHKRRGLPPNCDSTPATAGQAAPSSTPAPGDPAATGSAPAPGTSTASKNCPPSKVIVRQGGTSEPSIQLAGGSGGDQTSHQRDTANQMLGATDANLKKIAGRQLSPNQQDMVNQIRQFMDQSKTAVNAGDLERARTLAWKAQLLSEELVKPEK